MNRTVKITVLLLATMSWASACTKTTVVKKKKASTDQGAINNGGDHQPSIQNPGQSTPEPGVGDPGVAPSPNEPSTGAPAPNPQQPNTNPGPNPQATFPPFPAPFNKPVQTVELLRMYCKGCHAIESYGLKFITSDLDSDVVKFILTTKTAKNIMWAEAILKSLAWPAHQPPAEDDKTLMPIGGKKFRMNSHNFNSSVTDRELLVTKLQELIKQGP